MMDWVLIGVIAEVIGAVAVVITIAFLAIEIRHNREANQSETLSSLSVGFNETNYKIVESRDFADIWEKGHRDPQSLKSADIIRFSMQMQSYINHCTSLEKYHSLKVLPDEEWETFLAAIVEIMNTPGGKWLESRLIIPAAVRRELEMYGPPRQEYSWSIPKQHPPNDSVDARTPTGG